MARKKKTDVTPAMGEYPMITFTDAVVIPMVPQPIKIEDPVKIKFINWAFENNQEIFVAYAPEDNETTDGINVFRYGTLCHVDKVLQMPGAPTLAFFIPKQRAFLNSADYTREPIVAHCSLLPEIAIPKKIPTYINLIIERIESLFSHLMNYLPDPEKMNAESMVRDFSKKPAGKIYAMVNMAPLSAEDKYKVLECMTFDHLVETAVVLLDEAQQKIAIQAEIHERTHHELSQQQKETFLRVQLKHIREELGDDSEDADINDFISKASQKKWNKDTEQHFHKELAKLRRLNINNPEYSVQYSYLENFLSLPWNNYSHKSISLDKVREILNRDHFGLEKVKERIIEQMAVIKLRKDLKAPIICLLGPPGTGKTSIGKSVAEALGREYIRISLGGLHDEAEIRGHRRTYIGAMPGRFLHSLSKSKTGNPLMLLDEIDKVGKDFKGDPSSALLEALDPEQNNTFHDNFIDYPYDLSKVLFIATANDISTIPAPLRDRMEIIELSGYIPSEKREIAMRHLVKKALFDTGLEKDEVSFTPDAVDYLIRHHTREAGVRQLEKKIASILRKIALKKASHQDYPTVINSELVEEYLGKMEYYPESYDNNDFAGVATGLAWTPVGGDILFIETSLSPGKGEKLSLTGNLGDVMKESAMIALQYLKANASPLGINPEIFRKVDIHIHVPEGAVPKDGPSAGITLATAMASAFTGRKVRELTAMTGELTLRGKVIPVGGVKEKIIAARQAGITRIILSEKNRKDIEEIAPQYIEGLEFFYVDTLKDVFDNALTSEQAPYRFTFLDSLS